MTSTALIVVKFGIRPHGKAVGFWGKFYQWPAVTCSPEEISVSHPIRVENLFVKKMRKSPPSRLALMQVSAGFRMTY